MSKKIKSRIFETGAIRDKDNHKLDFEGYLSPLVISRYGEHMLKNTKQPDGTIRNSDDWQKGIPKNSYIKSAWRHFLDVWKYHRGIKTKEEVEVSLCSLLFNIQGYLHEVLKERNK